MHVLDVITHFQLKMLIVEHSRRNWLSDAPEGKGGGGNIFSRIGEGITRLYM